LSKVDLHLHTTASDGRSTPAELVAHARAGGVTVMAATDHDTTAASAEVARLAQAEGISAVTGIEITAVVDQRDVHVLGYFVDAANASLAAFLARQREDRVARLEAMAARLAAAGVPVDVAAILARGRADQSRAIGRPHLARAMVDAGHVADTREAFDQWLIEGRPGFVPRTGAAVEGVVEIIHRAGGLASIAHPGKTRQMDDRLPALRGAGLDAIEVFHPDHDEAAVARYQQYATALGLLMTGGSDFHGDPGHGLAPGSVTLPQPHWERLLERRGVR
jgi:predicted metal-dependent phosphoesterase TrpH